MRHFFRHFHFLTSLAAVLLFSGCDYDQYGENAYYKDDATHKIKVVSPPNVPFISQQFRLYADGSEAGKLDGEHPGIDIREVTGYPVIATAPGRVVKSYYGVTYGNQVEILHVANDRGEQMLTVYKHLDARLVKTGDTVQRGQKIATLGATGALAVWPHLHFETYAGKGVTHRPVDPHFFWARGVGRVTCFDAAGTYPAAPYKATFPVPCK
ncbi:MAG: M23 family metallopeptidase [Rhodobacteraceae bacterium]|nr:M23 family metallopeptidase [Paracoccaceae bacterium]